MTEQEPTTNAEQLLLARIFFMLPEPISLPDGYKMIVPIESDDATPPHPDDLFVSLIFHQVDASHGRTSAALEAQSQALARSEGLPPRLGERATPEMSSEWTVVEAMTPWNSPEPSPETKAEHPAHWSPNSDAFARCLHAARQVVRAYRQATETPYGLPTYAQTISPILSYSATGVKEITFVDGAPVMEIRPTQEIWDGPQIVRLDHVNLPDPLRERPYDEDIEMLFQHWYRTQESSNPLSLWRERWIEARRAHLVLGEEGQAVILANTSCEVLLDVVLALLVWEDEVSIEDAVPVFEPGKTLRRINQSLAPRLGGNWSTKNGAVGTWYEATYRLRHRVVHAGYYPTVSESARALDAAAGLHQFIMDRIAERRTKYPRAALMTVAEAGLRKRDLWSGKIKRFAEESAPLEPNWVDSYTAWYTGLVAKLAP